MKNGKEKEAYDLLQYNPFQTVSWNPKLEEALKSILLYRKTGAFIDEKKQYLLEVSPQEVAKEAKIKPVTVPKDEPKFFAELEFLKQNPQEKEHLPADFKELLTGPDAFAAAFLSAG